MYSSKGCCKENEDNIEQNLCELCPGNTNLTVQVLEAENIIVNNIVSTLIVGDNLNVTNVSAELTGGQSLVLDESLTLTDNFIESNTSIGTFVVTGNNVLLNTGSLGQYTGFVNGILPTSNIPGKLCINMSKISNTNFNQEIRINVGITQFRALYFSNLKSTQTLQIPIPSTELNVTFTSPGPVDLDATYVYSLYVV